MGLTWHWGPTVLREMRRWDIPWVALDRDLTKEELGGSPGDIAWFKGELLIEKRCPKDWVVHEIAHYIVCKYHTPEMLLKNNWGLDDYWHLPDDEKAALCRVVGIKQGVKGWDDWMESEACFLTCALLIHLNLPWHATSNELGNTEEFWPKSIGHHWRYGSPPEDPRAWKVVRERTLHHTKHYIEGIYG